MFRTITLPFFYFFLLAAVMAPEIRAERIYRCQKDGVILFTNVATECGHPLVLGGARSDSTPGFKRYERIILAAAERHGVDAELVRAIIKVESDFNAEARSIKGAQGLMQLMPDTARLHNIGNAYDPNENIDGGVRHLRLLLEQYNGDLELTLAAYNAGIKAVEKYRGVPPFSETKEYIRRVLSHYSRYRNGQF
ncbi:MAG TPA: lytic transglycosylase domain-containing protein [Candidatus Acidoferrales bacterium]|nr:lytic transglycosylase domain-containing protein [Candidatus Acidoferrales bacterium]